MTPIEAFKQIYKSNREEKERTYDTRKNRQIQSQIMFKNKSYDKFCNQNNKHS